MQRKLEIDVEREHCETVSCLKNQIESLQQEHEQDRRKRDEAHKVDCRITSSLKFFQQELENAKRENSHEIGQLKEVH